MSTPKEILKQYWGYDSFRPLQQEIIGAVLDKQPVLALLPTGGGKSVCFQVPAMCLQGICIVVSPLIALMKDQVEQLQRRGIKAVAVYSGMSRREIDIILDNCVYGGVKFLYVSPERLQTELFLGRAEQMNISMLAIDEAHCISQWGYDFRPPYLQIRDFIDNYKVERVVALTASATKQVKLDIQEKLGMDGCRVFQQSFARSNLSYSVFNLEAKEQKLLEILGNVPGSSVVYVRSRKQTQMIADFLRAHQISADYYHAGLSGHVRANRQEQWIAGKIRVIVSTNAFGMGIDKPDVRTVVHFDLPDSLEAYYQEAGRAGRDGKKAFAVQLYSTSDLENLKRRVDQSAVPVDLMKRTYQALANFFKLAVGSSSFSSFEFQYEAFIRRFELPKVETYHAIRKLAEEGLIELNESFKEASKVIFLLPQQELYSFQVANKNLDPVIKVLLRLYGGELFMEFITVREQDIAALLKESVSAVTKQLEYLHQAEVIIYQHATDKPRLTFLTPRIDANNLPIDKEKIEWRRQVALSKADMIGEYVKSAFVCRTRMIQNYFDESTAENCGICDICLARKKKHQHIPLSALESYINESPRTEEELNNHFKQMREEELVMGLRYLMDQKKIFLTLDERFTTTKQN